MYDFDCVIVSNFFTVLYMDNIPLYIAIVASLVTALMVAVIVQTAVVPWMRKKIEREAASGKAKFIFGDSDGKLPILLS